MVLKENLKKYELTTPPPAECNISDFPGRNDNNSKTMI